MELSPLQLQRVLIYSRASHVVDTAPFFNASLLEAQVDTPLRAAMYLAQLAHESQEFHLLHEMWGPTIEQARYEPPHPKAAQLGNTEPGDGKRFRGRGAIQLTGRANYRAAAAALGLPLEEMPELAELPEHAFRVAAWFWVKHELNGYSDKGDLEGCTKRINGGLNGLQERWRYFDRACEVLGALSLHVGGL